MNIIDEQYEKMMKNLKINSPSANFTYNVMSRIHAETAIIKNESIVADYQPIISKKTWIILCGIASVIILFIVFAGNFSVTTDKNQLVFSVSEYLSGLKLSFFSESLNKASQFIYDIPGLAYLVLISSLLLWLLDSVFQNKFRANIRI